MSLRTAFFNLLKLVRTDRYSIDEFNTNMDIIDEEMHRPPLTVNEIEPDPETRNIQIETVPLADNLTSDEAQINTGTFIVRTSGGEASIADGSAWLSDIRGNMSKSGYSPESLNMTVTPAAREEGVNPITATIDRETFFDEVSGSGTMIFAYASGWSNDPATYGITVDGTPIDGDLITVTYVKGNRGTITVATPTSFVSTGWNLYNHAAGYARVVNYSDEYGFMIDGTYTVLEFSETLSGTKTTITPVDGFFTINADGYVWVTGGNETDTAIWMTWSDWTDEPNGGVFEPYSATTVDLSGVMVDFPDGLMRIGNNYDEINLNTGRAYSRIQKMEYTTENLEAVIASGVEYDTDENYIYAVRQFPATYTISLDGEYTVSDHGLEMYVGTTLPVTSSSLYGQDLKGKLRRDVVTISQQTLTSAQQAQVRTNIGAGSAAAVASNSEAIANVQNGLAYIVGNTNTTGATLAVGQFVYVKGHSTIAEGLRKVTASISANGNITTSNTSACSEGGLNAVNSKITNMSFGLVDSLPDASNMNNGFVGFVLNSSITVDGNTLLLGTRVFGFVYNSIGHFVAIPNGSTMRTLRANGSTWNVIGVYNGS